MSAPLNLTIKNRLEDMEIGDCIPCRYTALTNGSVGYFSELGTSTTTEIPLNSSATPNGLFYFIKVDKGLLIADRVIQSNISWDTLNTAKFIEQSPLGGMIPLLSSNNDKGYKCYSSSVFANDSRYQAYRAFDGEPIYDNSWASEGPSGILGIVMPFAQPLITYTVATSSTYSNVGPKDFTIEGSNDTTTGLNGTWSVIDTRANITALSPVNGSVTYNINSTINFKSYRISITANNGNPNYCFIGKLLFNFKPSDKLIRCLSGGCAYADANGNKSVTSYNKGAWPTNNEWDKYIVNSNLNNKITPGDDNIWHWRSLFTWCKETPIVEINVNTYRVVRGYFQANTFAILSSTKNTYEQTFRPVLEYIEPESKQTNLFY